MVVICYVSGLIVHPAFHRLIVFHRPRLTTVLLRRTACLHLLLSLICPYGSSWFCEISLLWYWDWLEFNIKEWTASGKFGGLWRARLEKKWVWNLEVRGVTAIIPVLMCWFSSFLILAVMISWLLHNLFLRWEFFPCMKVQFFCLNFSLLLFVISLVSQDCDRFIRLSFYLRSVQLYQSQLGHAGETERRFVCASSNSYCSTESKWVKWSHYLFSF